MANKKVTKKKATPTKTNKKAAKKTTTTKKKVTKKKVEKKKVTKKVEKKTVKKATAKKVSKKTTKKETKKTSKKVKKKVTKKATAKEVLKKDVIVEEPSKKKSVTKKSSPKKAASSKKKEEEVEKTPSKKSSRDFEDFEEEEFLETASEDLGDDEDFDDDDFSYENDGGPRKYTEESQDDEDFNFFQAKKSVSFDEARSEIAEEVVGLAEEYDLRDILDTVRGVGFFTLKSDDCIESTCDNPSIIHGHCRFHYIKNWKEIKRKEAILKEGELQNFIEDLLGKYPVSFLEKILEDFASEKSFFKALKGLNIDLTDADLEYENRDGDIDDQDIAYETKDLNRPHFDE